MTYQELKNIAKLKLKISNNILPQDAFKIAKNLKLQIKNSVECKKDFQDFNKTPLRYCNALYAIRQGKYVIYHNEKYIYKNFAIAHEIAHHLLKHTKDGVQQHHDANLLAAIIVAPSKQVFQSNIKTAIELSLYCKIPFNVAKEYWQLISIYDINN